MKSSSRNLTTKSSVHHNQMISITVHSLKKSWLFLIITQVFRDTCFEKNASYHHSNTNSLLLLFSCRKCFVRKFLKLWCWQNLFETSMLTEYIWNLDVLRICLKLWYWQKVSKTLLLSEILPKKFEMRIMTESFGGWLTMKYWLDVE